MSKSQDTSRADWLGDLQMEVAACWRQLPEKPFFFGLLVVWALLFQFLGSSTFGYTDTASLFGWMFNAYNVEGSEDSHGKLIPFVVLGLFWWKRRELLEVPKHLWWPGLVGVGLAVGLHIAGYMAQQPRVSIVAFFAGLYALMGLAWGPRLLRASFFPFVLLVFCIPIASLSESITFPLRMLVTKISVGIGQGLGIEVIRDGSRIFDAQGGFQYDVAPACSGIRSLISLLALTTIYGFITFTAAWKRLLMVVIAVPLAVAGNVVRITGVILAAQAFGQDAGVFVEQKLGFVTFAVAIVCVLALGYWLRERKSAAALEVELTATRRSVSAGETPAAR